MKEKLFKLPPDCHVYPAHDYKGATYTTIEEERNHNPRLADKVSKERFQEIMAGLNLPPPKLLDVAQPANLNGGREVSN